MVKTEVIPHPTVPLWLVRGTTHRGTTMLASMAFMSREEAMRCAHAATGHELPVEAPHSAPTASPDLDPVLTAVSTPAPPQRDKLTTFEELEAEYGADMARHVILRRAEQAYAAKPSPLNRLRLNIAKKEAGL